MKMLVVETPNGRRPTARACNKGQRELLRIGLPLLLVIILVLPICCTNVGQQTSTSRNNVIDEHFEPSSNLIRINLPYYVHSVAAGNTTHGRGVAWIFNGTLRFRDPINLVDASVDIGMGSVFHQTLIGADIDADGFTEFLVMVLSGSMNLVVVDFDTSSATEYEMLLGDPLGIIIGDFNGDSIGDLMIGAPPSGGNGQDESGSVFVVYGRTGLPSGTTVALDEDTMVPQIIRLYRIIPGMDEFLHAPPLFAMASFQRFKKLCSCNCS